MSQTHPISDRIHFHTPGRVAAMLPYRVLVAGESLATRVAPHVTQRFHQHVLIHTLRGRGQVRHSGQVHSAPAGSLVWLDTALDYSHGCHLDEGFWHYIWVGFEGFALDSLFQTLGVSTQPVFEATPELGGIAGIVKLLTTGQSGADALLSAAMAQLLAGMMQQRSLPAQHADSERVLQVLTLLRGDVARPWRVEALAAQAGLSAAQLFRQFRQVTGTTPIDWLRHERINLAKRLLVETSARIANIGQHCGYPDPYHFSRDFKRLAGQSPRAFRAAQGR